MSPARAPRQRGFTILEALIAMTVFLAILTAVVTVYAPTRLLYTRGERRSDAQQNARLAMAVMVREIRLAGYFPENSSASPPSPLLADPVLLAAHGIIVVHGDPTGSGATQATGYCRDGTSLRRMAAPRADTAAYTCSGGQVMAENVTDLRFTYYDENGDPLPDPPAMPYGLDGEGATGAVPDFTDMAERGSIRRVTITLTTQFESPQRGPTNYSITSEVWLRNG
jgi:Tfp pilus assembly protein PilW